MARVDTRSLTEPDKRVRRLSRASQDRVADIGAFVDEVLHGIRTVHAFCHEAVDKRRYRDLVDASCDLPGTQVARMGGFRSRSIRNYDNLVRGN